MAELVRLQNNFNGPAREKAAWRGAGRLGALRPRRLPAARARCRLFARHAFDRARPSTPKPPLPASGAGAPRHHERGLRAGQVHAAIEAGVGGHRGAVRADRDLPRHATVPRARARTVRGAPRSGGGATDGAMGRRPRPRRAPRRRDGALRLGRRAARARARRALLRSPRRRARRTAPTPTPSPPPPPPRQDAAVRVEPGHGVVRDVQPAQGVRGGRAAGGGVSVEQPHSAGGASPHPSPRPPPPPRRPPPPCPRRSPRSARCWCWRA
jgi:hypothetical protein